MAPRRVKFRELQPRAPLVDVDYEAIELRTIAEQIAAVTFLQALLYALHGARITFLCDGLTADFEVG